MKLSPPEHAGFSYAALKDGKISTAVGGTTRGEDGLFQAASLSKTVFSFLCFLLEKDLEQPVHDVLPAPDIPARVTLAHLLSHQAGLNVPGFPGYAAGEKVPSLLQAIAGAGNTPGLIFREDLFGQYAYSGLGYCIAQLYLEKKHGKDLDALAQENIFHPCGMTYSSFSLHPKAAYVSAHDENGQIIPGDYHLYPEAAAAGLWTSPRELMLFVEAMLGHPLSRDFLKARVPDGNDGCYCLGLRQKAGVPLYMHDGSNRGFRCRLSFNAEKRAAFCVMTNAENGFSFINRNFPPFLEA